MLESGWVALAISTGFGFLAGLGVGGGSLLIIWLTQVLCMPHPQARIINLLFFLPAAVIATLFRKKEGVLSLKYVFPAVLAGSLAAVSGALLGQHLDLSYIKKAFGVLLLITGVREILASFSRKACR